MPLTQILILNWNNGADTLLCLESVLALPGVRIAILDNHSTDDSVALIARYLEGHRIEHRQYWLQDVKDSACMDVPVSLFTSAANLGFAGGNNLLLRLLQQEGKTAYAWLLNNDAIAAPGALQALHEAMEKDAKIAFAGSVILDYGQRDRVQCCGVRYYKYFGVAKLLFKDRRWDSITAEELRDAPIDFQNGASLLVRMAALSAIGLMDERFFLYAEEHDWQYRARALGYRDVLAAGSLVYHKGSMSTNSRKYLFFYYYSKSSVLFSRKHHSFAVALCASILLLGITLIRTRLHLKSLRWALKGMSEAWRHQRS